MLAQEGRGDGARDFFAQFHGGAFDSPDDAAAVLLQGALKRAHANGGREAVRSFLRTMLKPHLQTLLAANRPGAALAIIDLAAALGTAAEGLMQFSAVEGDGRFGATVAEELRARIYRIVMGDTFALNLPIRRRALDLCFSAMAAERAAQQRLSQRSALRYSLAAAAASCGDDYEPSSCSEASKASGGGSCFDIDSTADVANCLVSAGAAAALAATYTRGGGSSSFSNGGRAAAAAAGVDAVAAKFKALPGLGRRLAAQRMGGLGGGPDVGSWGGLWGAIMDGLVGAQAMPLLESVLQDLYISGNLSCGAFTRSGSSGSLGGSTTPGASPFAAAAWEQEQPLTSSSPSAGDADSRGSGGENSATRRHSSSSSSASSSEEVLGAGAEKRGRTDKRGAAAAAAGRDTQAAASATEISGEGSACLCLEDGDTAWRDQQQV